MKWLRAGLLLLAAGLSALGWRVYDWATDEDTPRVDEHGCVIGDPFRGIYLELRLELLDRCLSAEGIVHNVRRAEDGDITFDLELDPVYEHLLNEVNYERLNGWLHIEVIPLDQDRVPIPREGERARVTGVHVIDNSHGGHNELHPATQIIIFGQ